MAKSLKGYKAFRMGAIAVDGSMGTTLAPLGTTVKGSTSASTSEAQTQDFFIEEQSGAFESSVTEDPFFSGVLELYDVHPLTAVKVFGGTTASVGTGASKKLKFIPPTSYTPLEQSIEIESKNGAVLGITRAQILPVWNLSYQDGELGKIVINWKQLVPTKDGEPGYTFTVPDPA